MVAVSALLAGSVPPSYTSPHLAASVPPLPALASPRPTPLGASLTSPLPAKPLGTWTSILELADEATNGGTSLQPGTLVAERERLTLQAVELKDECQRLAKEGREHDERIASQEAEVNVCNLRCTGLEELIRQRRERLVELELQADSAKNVSLPLETTAFELRQKLSFGDKSEDYLRLRLGTAMRASGGLSDERAKLERQALDADGEVRRLRAELDETAVQVRGADDDNVATAAALELSLAAGRKQLQDVIAESASCSSEARSSAVALRRARDELTTLEEQLSACEAWAQARQADNRRRTKALELQAKGLSASSARAREEAKGREEAQVALKKTCVEANARRIEIELCRNHECDLHEQLARERAAAHAEEETAARIALEAAGIEEQFLVDAADHEKMRRMQADVADSDHGELRSELASVKDVVARSTQSLGAIREKLLALNRLSAHLEVSQRTAEATAGDLRTGAAKHEAVQHEVKRRLHVLQGEAAVLRQQASAAAVAQRSRLDERERECRNLSLEASQLRRDEAQRAEVVAAEERHRINVESRLRSGLCSAEDSLEAQRVRLEERNAGLAREALRLESERIQAEAELQDAQATLEARLAAHSDAECRRASELRAAKQRARDTDEDPAYINLVAKLQTEANGLRAEEAALRQAIKRVEALNAGLRAQVHVFKQHQAEGANASWCSPNSALAKAAAAATLAKADVLSPRPSLSSSPANFHFSAAM